MRTEFPEVWEGLLKDEFPICLQAIKRKAQIIRTEERKLMKLDPRLDEQIESVREIEESDFSSPKTLQSHNMEA